MTLAVGSRLGVYDITGLLGAGGMGEAYRARDTRLGRDVAIKVLFASFAADADRLARFEREARLLASVNHPNIGAIDGVEESAGVVALVLELVEGETLADRLTKNAGRPLGRLRLRRIRPQRDLRRGLPGVRQQGRDLRRWRRRAAMVARRARAVFSRGRCPDDGGDYVRHKLARRDGWSSVHRPLQRRWAGNGLRRRTRWTPLRDGQERPGVDASAPCRC